MLIRGTSYCPPYILRVDLIVDSLLVRARAMAKLYSFGSGEGEDSLAAMIYAQSLLALQKPKEASRDSSGPAAPTAEDLD